MNGKLEGGMAELAIMEDENDTMEMLRFERKRDKDEKTQVHKMILIFFH